MNIEDYPVPPAGPMVLGANAGLAAGTFSSITSIVAPGSAVVGQVVSFLAWVKNISEPGYWFFLAATARYNGIDISISPGSAEVLPGEEQAFSGAFTMPNASVRLEIWSFFWNGTDWVYDDYLYKDIALAVSYTGTIINKVLVYNSSQGFVPVVDVPQGKLGVVHLWGRNDMSTQQRMGMNWIVEDPDRVVVNRYSSVAPLPYTSPGATREFIGGTFTLGKLGTYKLTAVLFFGDPADPDLVDGYSGPLCTVAPVIPPSEFAEFLITEYTK